DRRLVAPASLGKDAHVVGVDRPLPALVAVQRNVDAGPSTRPGDPQQGRGPKLDPFQVAIVGQCVAVAVVGHVEVVGRAGYEKTARHGVRQDQLGAVGRGVGEEVLVIGRARSLVRSLGGGGGGQGALKGGRRAGRQGRHAGGGGGLGGGRSSPPAP